MRNVSIVIPNWNGRDLLPEFLPSVFAAAERYRARHAAEAEVIVVDDASTDGSALWLKENSHGRARIIEREQNGGFVGAVNTGFAAARHPVVFLLNNDVRVEEDAIAPLVKHFDDEEVFAVCAKAYRLGTGLLDGAGKLGLFERGFWRVFLNYDVLPTRLPEGRGPFYSFFGSGGYTAYDRAKFSELGGFCELLAPIYWEDVELSYRAWRRGWQVRYEPASVVHHKSSATMGKQALRRPMKIVTERNRLLMTWVNLHDARWLASHLAWLALKLVGATLSLDRAYWQSFLQAAARLSAVRLERRRARQSARRTDRELAAVFKRLVANDWIEVIRSEADYRRYVELKRRLESEAAR
jgi:GT2 family glycosyltransferase